MQRNYDGGQDSAATSIEGVVGSAMGAGGGISPDNLVNLNKV